MPFAGGGGGGDGDVGVAVESGIVHSFHCVVEVLPKNHGSIVQRGRWSGRILAMLLGVLGLFVEVGRSVVVAGVADVAAAAVVEQARRQRHEMIACHLAGDRCYSAG